MFSTPAKQYAAVDPRGEDATGPSRTRTSRSRSLPVHFGLVYYFLLVGLIIFPLLAVRQFWQTQTSSKGMMWSTCSAEEGAGSKRHEYFLSKLNGRRISFIGDGIIRFQYLELAHYLAHGTCIDSADPGDTDDVIKSLEDLHDFEQDDFTNFNKFLQTSSADLNVRKDGVFTNEVCMGSRLRLMQSWTDEQRIFLYMDDAGRRIELAYSQYFDEGISRLKQTIAAVNNFLPTDVVMNFGAVFESFPNNTDCGNQWSDGSKSKSVCPFMKGVCKYLKQDHPYNMYWQSTTPKLETLQMKSLNYVMGPGHNLNPILACDLPISMVLDTGEMLQKFAPQEREQASLFTAENALLPEAYHAFNWNLVQRLPSLTMVQAREAWNHTWKPGDTFSVSTI